MQRILARIALYVALTALASLPFIGVLGTYPPSAHRVLADTSSTKIKTATSSKIKATVASAATKPDSVPPAVVAQPAPVAVAPPVAAKPAFNPADSSTWPTCPAGQIVRADNGQCAAPAVSALNVANIAAAAPVTYSSDHYTLLAQAGIAASDFGYADYIVMHEGHYDPCVRYGNVTDCSYAANGGQLAYGVCQSLPGSKMAANGADWATNPITQLQWCASYAVARYGSWYAAYLYWTAHNNW